eukprot:2656313-Rhodomonas_salina.1
MTREKLDSEREKKRFRVCLHVMKRVALKPSERKREPSCAIALLIRENSRASQRSESEDRCVRFNSVDQFDRWKWTELGHDDNGGRRYGKACESESDCASSQGGDQGVVVSYAVSGTGIELLVLCVRCEDRDDGGYGPS